MTTIHDPIPTAMAAIADADCAVHTAIHILDGMHRLQESIALLMLSSELEQSAATLRWCRGALDRSRGMQ